MTLVEMEIGRLLVPDKEFVALLGTWKPTQIPAPRDGDVRVRNIASRKVSGI